MGDLYLTCFNNKNYWLVLIHFFTDFNIHSTVLCTPNLNNYVLAWGSGRCTSAHMAPRPMWTSSYIYRYSTKPYKALLHMSANADIINHDIKMRARISEINRVSDKFFRIFNRKCVPLLHSILSFHTNLWHSTHVLSINHGKFGQVCDYSLVTLLRNGGCIWIRSYSNHIDDQCVHWGHISSFLHMVLSYCTLS